MHIKGNHKQNEKTTHRMGENICKQCDLKGINLQNLQTAHAAQYQKNKQLNQNMGRKPLDIYPKKTYRWPIVMWNDAQHR